jgi:signal transduction histidine kinase
MMDSTHTAWHLFVWQSSEELFAPVYHLRNWIITFGAISFGLLLLLGIMVSKRVVRPILILQSAAKRIANRELMEPIVIKTGDEIEDLAEELNQMNAQLQAAISGLVTEVETKTQEVEYLRESTTQILDGIPDPVIMVDEHLEVQYMNLAFKHTVGLTDGQSDTQNLLQLISLNAQEHQQLSQQVRSLLGLSPTGTAGDGGKASTPSKPLNDPLLQHHTKAPSANDTLLTIDNRIFRYNGFRIPSRPGENPTCGLVLRDATDEQRLQDALINSEKATSLEVLCSGIRHELNNPLVGVIGLAEAIQGEEDGTKTKEHAKAIVQQGQRMAKVIRDLTGQVRGQDKAAPIALDLNEQLDLIVDYMHVQEEYPHVTIQKEYHALPTLYGLAEEVRLVLYHVIKNAIQGMHEKGRLTLGTQTNHAGAIEIHIDDTGAGIPPNFLPKVFDPFFTTKLMGEGSGLGLTIVQRIVKKYRGRVEIDSQEGEGTQCRIIFPSKDLSHV